MIYGELLDSRQTAKHNVSVRCVASSCSFYLNLTSTTPTTGLSVCTESYHLSTAATTTSELSLAEFRLQVPFTFSSSLWANWTRNSTLRLSVIFSSAFYLSYFPLPRGMFDDQIISPVPPNNLSVSNEFPLSVSCFDYVSNSLQE